MVCPSLTTPGRRRFFQSACKAQGSAQPHRPACHPQAVSMMRDKPKYLGCCLALRRRATTDRLGMVLAVRLHTHTWRALGNQWVRQVHVASHHRCQHRLARCASRSAAAKSCRTCSPCTGLSLTCKRTSTWVSMAFMPQSRSPLRSPSETAVPSSAALPSATHRGHRGYCRRPSAPHAGDPTPARTAGSERS